LFATTTLDQTRLPANSSETKTETIAEQVVSQESISTSKGNNLIDPKTKKAVESYFSDNPILVHIAFCESSFRQTDKDGNVLRGTVLSEDVGVMQINERYHKTQSEKLGYDIYTLEGNMAYAKWLYEREGAKPWMSSSKCWSNRINKDLALK